MATYSVFRSRFKKAIIDAVYQEIISGTAIYHHFFGKENSWSDNASPQVPSNTSDEPLAPENNQKYELDARRDILTTKKVLPSDISYVIKRFDWVSGTIYDMYDDAYSVENPAESGATSLEDPSCNFYVLTVQNNVYKCIWNNNGGPSTQMPTGNSTEVFSTSDGYKWKFMYNIPLSLRNRFLTTTNMPVSTALKAKYYSTGEISNIIINNGGYGYHPLTTTATITGDGYKESNPYTIDSNITIDSAGSGYSVAPEVTIEDPFVADSWVAEGSTILGSYIKHTYGGQTNFYLVESGTEFGLGQPTHTTGSAANGNTVLKYIGTTAMASATISGDEVDTITLDNVGYGYSFPPAITLEGNATAHVTVTVNHAEIELDISPAGEIVGFTIVDGGVGYTEASITVEDSDGDPGTGAVLLADFSLGNINTIQSNVELLAVPGSIEAIKMVDTGANYTSAEITIMGDGTGATAHAVITNGKLKSIIVDNAGQGYTWAQVYILGYGNDIIDASARAIMSPLGGHGSNCINELNAKKLVFYTSLSRDFNQGFDINNDYRKTGLIKNMSMFNSTRRFNNILGSGCIMIEGSFDKTKLQADMLLYQKVDTYKKYRIVDFNDTQILLSPYGNFGLNTSTVLVSDPTDEGLNTNPVLPPTEIEVNIVNERTVDVFSGDLLMYTVRDSFSPTPEQIITVRTTLEI